MRFAADQKSAARHIRLQHRWIFQADEICLCFATGRAGSRSMYDPDIKVCRPLMDPAEIAAAPPRRGSIGQQRGGFLSSER